MARTSRGGAPAANFDNLNLDDMFADGGDDLFDGLDIDLGNMDEFSNNAQQPQAAPPAAPLTQDIPEDAPKRRTTKRKTKSRYAFDDDEDYTDMVPAKKKSKSTGSPRKRTSKKATAVESKNKKRNSVGADAATAASVVAAAGQFGGRQKRGNSFTTKMKKLPTGKSGADGKKARGDGSLLQPVGTPVGILGELALVLSSHPGLTQGPFCGLESSEFLFYPFLQTLPSETIVKTRKIFPVVDRIHSTLLSHIQGSKPVPPDTEPIKLEEKDPIFQLIQEAYKEPTSAAETATIDRVGTVGNTVSALRNSISELDRKKLAGDMYAVCALLKRQHDFLKQNLNNMERWCKQYLPTDEYEIVYMSQKAKKKKEAEIDPLPSLLISFNSAEVRVKITLESGFKPPRKTPLLALLPATHAPKGKKRKTSVDGSLTTSISTSAPKEKSVPYSECRPIRRRKYIADLVARTARELESTYQQKIDERTQIVSRQEAEINKLSTEHDATGALNTTSMWKYLERSNLLGTYSSKEVRNRLDGIRYPIPQPEKEPDKTEGGTGEKINHAAIAETSLVDRLTSLLVEECMSDGDGEDDIDVVSDGFLCETVARDEGFVDLSELSEEEKAFVHLNAVGLLGVKGLLSLDKKFASRAEKSENEADVINHLDEKQSTQDDTRAKSGVSPDPRENGGKLVPPADISACDVEEMIARLNVGLAEVTDLNNKRADFLESVALANNLCIDKSRQIRDEETSLISKCQSLLKKRKETKAKVAKAKVATPENPLPW